MVTVGTMVRHTIHSTQNISDWLGTEAISLLQLIGYKYRESVSLFSIIFMSILNMYMVIRLTKMAIRYIVIKCYSFIDS